MPNSVFKVPFITSEKILQQWFETPLGRQVFTAEVSLLNEWLSPLFGYHLLQIGAMGQHVRLVQDLRIKQTFVLSSLLSDKHDERWIQASLLELPIASHSIDVVVLPHALDFSDDPHQLLREIERVLIPDGRVIIVGFNPLSSWGIRRLFSRKRHIPWTGHFISRHRVIDWLALLGMEVEQTQGVFFRPPIKNLHILMLLSAVEKIDFLSFFSGVYAIQAVKREFTLTALDPRWKLSANFIGSRIVKPALRNFVMSERVVIYTDGACKGNPGPGGWGALLLYKGRERELCGGETHTTNNRMEIMAVIGALTELKKSSRLQIITDSQYVKNGINQWIHNWKRNGWLTAAKKPVKNSDLWKQLDTLVAQHDVQWKWVKGHSGDLGNERADQLANDGIGKV